MTGLDLKLRTVTDMKSSWEDIETPWQLTLEMAWESFKNNSLPIAAIIINTEGNVVTTGRNRMFEHTVKNKKMAHAEMNALMNLPYDEHPEIRKYTMYTTTEPCPMCMGSIVMSDLRKVRIAMADPWAGAADICQKLPYIVSKNINISYVGGAVEKLVSVLAAYKELELSNGKLNPVAERLKQHQARSFSLAESLFSENALRKYAGDNISFCNVFDIIMA